MPATTKRKSVAKKRTVGARKKTSGTRCGLCGKTKNLTKTQCCGHWVCADADKYVLFSYARNSCYRNHDRYTMCSSHFHEKHEGDWRECKKCRENFDTEMYVHFCTNEYNFEKLENPPAFEPTRCKDCGSIIDLGRDGYSMKGGDYFCTNCHKLPFS